MSAERLERPRVSAEGSNVARVSAIGLESARA